METSFIKAKILSSLVFLFIIAVLFFTKFYKNTENESLKVLSSENKVKNIDTNLSLTSLLISNLACETRNVILLFSKSISYQDVNNRKLIKYLKDLKDLNYTNFTSFTNSTSSTNSTKSIIPTSFIEDVNK
jgi:hypothetical protein